MCVYIYIHIYTHKIHTHTHTYNVFICIFFVSISAVVSISICPFHLFHSHITPTMAMVPDFTIFFHDQTHQKQLSNLHPQLLVLTPPAYVKASAPSPKLCVVRNRLGCWGSRPAS